MNVIISSITINIHTG